MKRIAASLYFLGIFAFCMLMLFLSGCKSKSGMPSYPISSDVYTTCQRTITFPVLAKLLPNQLCEVSKYAQYGYGNWTFGPGLAAEQRLDLMPKGYVVSSRQKKQKLLSFFTITDIHITDKESPSQLIYLQQLNARNAHVTSVYFPVMLHTPHVLDAAIQTINALHKKNPIDFVISLGDTCNSTQYNETRWYIDVIDGKLITPSSGAHVGADIIDYQKPFKAAGLDPAIPWYQVIGNHDHFWMGSFPVSDFLRQSYVSDTVLAMGDVLANRANIKRADYYMGVLDGGTLYGTIINAGPVKNFASAPKVIADPNRRSLAKTEWMSEFFNTSSRPVGHGFNMTDVKNGFACYSFIPKANIPIKIIALDDTQREDDGSGDIHGHGFLDVARLNWLKKELADGQAADQLMIIAAHIPIGVDNFEMGWWNDAQNAITQSDLIKELQRYPNFILWIAGHRHCNTVKAFVSRDSVNHPEHGFWQIETASLRDFPQQFRLFEIYLNSDYTISIVTTNVDPAVADKTPAAISRSYAIAVQQIVNNQQKYQMPSTLPDVSIKPMPTGSYNAELVKQLSPAMKEKMRGC